MTQYFLFCCIQFFWECRAHSISTFITHRFHSKQLVKWHLANSSNASQIGTEHAKMVCIDFRRHIMIKNHTNNNNKHSHLLGWWTLCKNNEMATVPCSIMFCIFSAEILCRLHVINFRQIPTSRIINFWFEFYSDDNEKDVHGVPCAVCKFPASFFLSLTLCRGMCTIGEHRFGFIRQGIKCAALLSI